MSLFTTDPGYGGGIGWDNNPIGDWGVPIGITFDDFQQSAGGTDSTPEDTSLCNERATGIVNEAEAEMIVNVQAYHTGQITKGRALARFDELWAWMEQMLKGVGSCGPKSLAERDRGGIYDYFARYRNPIEYTFSTDVEEELEDLPEQLKKNWWLIALMLALIAVALAARKRR